MSRGAFEPGAGGGGGGSSPTAVWGVQRITTAGTHNLSSTVSLVVIAGPPGDVTVAMPAASGQAGRHVWIKRALSAHQTLVLAADSPEIARTPLDADDVCLHLASDGQNWLVL